MGVGVQVYVCVWVGVQVWMCGCGRAVVCVCVVCGGPVAPGLSFLLMASSRRCFLDRHPMRASHGRRNSFALSGTHNAKPKGGQVYEPTPHLAIYSPFPLLSSPFNPLPFFPPLPYPPLLLSLRLQLLLGSLWLVSSLAISVFRVVARELSQSRVPPIWNSLPTSVAV